MGDTASHRALAGRSLPAPRRLRRYRPPGTVFDLIVGAPRWAAGNGAEWETRRETRLARGVFLRRHRPRSLLEVLTRVARAKSSRPAALEAVGRGSELHVGEPFPVNRLTIVARDRSGKLLGPVPIAIEVDDGDPPLLNTKSDAIAESRLQPLRPGAFRFRARTICPHPPVQVVIAASVR